MYIGVEVGFLDFVVLLYVLFMLCCIRSKLLFGIVFSEEFFV